MFRLPSAHLNQAGRFLHAPPRAFRGRNTTAMATSTAQQQRQLSLERSRELEREAQEVHLQAQAANKEQRFEDAKALYAKMNALDNESLRLACEVALGSSSGSGSDASAPSQGAAPSVPYPLPAERRAPSDRIRGATLGSLLADAAATGIQWEYSLDNLSKVDTERGGLGDLTFLDPPRSPFLLGAAQGGPYSCGDLSPYGEQTFALLKSVAAVRGLDPEHYARTNLAHFSSAAQAARYRDAATKGFIRNMAAGNVAPPGADDHQANCVTRTCVIAAAFAGSPQLFEVVAAATVVTQNTPLAAAYARAAAAVLEAVVLGAEPEDAVRAAADRIERQEGEASGAIAGHLRAVLAELDAGSDVASFVAKYGRNCHQPNALQTPIYAALYALRAAKSQLGPGAAAPASPAEVYRRGVRLAVRQGGCCASRASFTGALVAGHFGWPECAPAEWTEKCRAFPEWESLVEALQ